MFTRPSPSLPSRRPASIVSTYPPLSQHVSRQCDNSVTTSQPATPPTANLTISKCPPASPICTKTRPRQPSRLPHHRAPEAHRNPSRHPFHRHPHPCGIDRALALRQLATLKLAALNMSAHSAARPDTDLPSLTPTCRRSQPAPPTQHAHQPSLRQPTTATNTESSSPHRTALCRARQP